MVGLVVGTISIIIGLKGPLPSKEYFNKCDHCNYKYKWYQLIPIVPFLMKGGRCPRCNKKSSYWYPFLELVSGLLFMVSYLIYGPSSFASFTKVTNRSRASMANASHCTGIFT